VGVTGDVKHAGPEKVAEPQLFISAERNLANRVEVAIRTSKDPETVATSVRQEIHALDQGLPVGLLVPLQQRLDDLTASRRFQMWLVAAFAGFGLLLAALGLYASVAYSVNQSRSEIALRMALGAERSQVRNIYLRKGLVVCGIGLMVGALGSLWLVKYTESRLFDVRPTDPISGLAAAGLLLSCCVVASYLPARSASRTDPNTLLRNQ